MAGSGRINFKTNATTDEAPGWQNWRPDAEPLVSVVAVDEESAAKIVPLYDGGAHWVFMSYDSVGPLRILHEIGEAIGWSGFLLFQHPCLLLTPPGGVTMSPSGMIPPEVNVASAMPGGSVYFGRHGSAVWREDVFTVAFVPKVAIDAVGLGAILMRHCGGELAIFGPGVDVMPLSDKFWTSLFNNLQQILKVGRDVLSRQRGDE